MRASKSSTWRTKISDEPGTSIRSTPLCAFELEHFQWTRTERVRHRQRAVGAQHFEPRAIRRAEARVDVRRHALVEPQHAHELLIHARRVPMRGAEHHLRFVPGNELRIGDGVAADVPQRAAAERGIRAGCCASVSSANVKPDTIARTAPMAPSFSSDIDPGRQRLMAIHEALFHDHAGRRGGGGNAIDVMRIERERLLAQHVLAGGDRGQRPRHVLGVGQRNVDGVDRGIVEQRLVTLRPRAGCRTRARVRSARASVRLATARSSPRRDARKAGIRRRLMRAVPRMPQRSISPRPSASPACAG